MESHGSHHRNDTQLKLIPKNKTGEAKQKHLVYTTHGYQNKRGCNKTKKHLTQKERFGGNK